MTRKKAKARDDETAERDERDQPDQPQPEQLPAPGGEPDTSDGDAGPHGRGVRFYDPADPNARPGQGWQRDDERDRAYRAAQARTGPGEVLADPVGRSIGTRPGLSGTHKPAEPNEGTDERDIAQNTFPAGKPEPAALQSGLTPGAGDPTNGVLTPEGKSPVSYARPDAATAQHYEAAEGVTALKRNADPYAYAPKDPATVPQNMIAATPSRAQPPASSEAKAAAHDVAGTTEDTRAAEKQADDPDPKPQVESEDDS